MLNKEKNGNYLLPTFLYSPILYYLLLKNFKRLPDFKRLLIILRKSALVAYHSESQPG